MSRILPPALLSALFFAGCLIQAAPAFLLPPPAVPALARPTRASRMAPCTMATPASASDGVQHNGRIKLQELLSSLRRPTKHETRTDPLNAVSCYLDRSAKIRPDVEELALHLAAERSIQCSRAAGDDLCDLSRSGSPHGRWKLEYSTDPLLQAASGLSDVHQELRATDKGTIIRSTWGSFEGKQIALEGVVLDGPASTKVSYVYKRSVACVTPWLHIPFPPAVRDGYFGVLFCDSAVRVDWEKSGAINVYSSLAGATEQAEGSEQDLNNMSASSLATGILAQVGGFLGADMRKDALGVWLSEWKARGEEAQNRALQRVDSQLSVRVPGIRFDRLTERIKPWALVLAAFLATSTGASAATQLVAEDPVAAAALVEPEGLSNGVAFALVAPLIAYKLAAVSKGQKLLPQLEFVILASVLSLVIRVGGMS
mmetsp:Transcript_17700/g.43305  ORF Transcript_17700/g.43305 Transcript_17700/m.43305 type:complete len:428 (+) Transcript_17700:96-1379(+)